VNPENYGFFREQQTRDQRKYRSKVTGQEIKGKKNKGALPDVDVCRLDVDEVREILAVDFSRILEKQNDNLVLSACDSPKVCIVKKP
jgi:hypothetical protein